MKLRVAIFGVVCAAQLGWAAATLWNAEVRREQGHVWRFRTAPVDPVDLLRGRYVRLAFEETSGPAVEGEHFAPGSTAYAHLAEDEHGFARVTQLTRRSPEGDAHLEVSVRSHREDAVAFDFPIDRFYLPEGKAPVAEERVRRGARHAWAEIRVRDGEATLLDVFVDGVPLTRAAEAPIRQRESGPPPPR